ncbi:hypothetical protein FRC02_007363 [Tulasnella sp. 418]|nr:hypothetical protein FRC02_007363 [Tulasnella sp. 418]
MPRHGPQPPPNAPQFRLDMQRVLRDPREHVTLPNPFCFILESEVDQQAWLAKEKGTVNWRKA